MNYSCDRGLTGPSIGRVVRALLVVCLLGPMVALAQESKLVVSITDVREGGGNLRVSLYAASEGFRKEDKALKLVSQAAAKGETKVHFEGLAPGRYAVMAYHDENGDGKLNLRFGMFPTEGYGLSNNPKVMGPPKFDDSAFEVAGPETGISIGLSY